MEQLQMVDIKILNIKMIKYPVRESLPYRNGGLCMTLQAMLSWGN